MNLLEKFAVKALKDEYFITLFNKAEDKYSKSYFTNNSAFIGLDKKEFIDLLRYADILSFGKNSNARNMSFKILSLLYADMKDDENYIFVANGILTRLGNFPSLSLVTNENSNFDTIETLIEKIVKYDYQKTPDNTGVFTDSQFQVFNRLINSNHFSFSGPTSFGKSFIMDAYIKYLINERPGLDNIVILVPTRALINQVSSRLRKEIDNQDYAVLTHPKVPSLVNGINKKFIFVFTPERLVSYYANSENPSIQYMFVDEAQKIVQENDSRSPLYYHAISMADRKSVKLFFASPNIPNADVFLKIFDKSTDETLAIKETPVAQNRFFVDLIEKEQWTFHDLNDTPIQTDYWLGNDFNELLKTTGRFDKNIIYCNSVKDTIDYALDFSYGLPLIEDPEIDELIKYIKKSVHKDYYLIDCLSKGVAFHFGRLPQRIRERVENLYIEGKINYIFCTSTLLEGVNLPAKNIYILNNKIGLSNFSKIDFWNLAGRAGRLNKELSGNIICVRCDENRWTVDKAIEIMASKGEEELKPLILTGRKNFYKNVVNSLNGTEFTRTTSKDEQEFLNGFANILYSHETSHTDSLLMNNFMKNTHDGKKVLAKISKTNQVPTYILEQSITIKPIYQNKILQSLKETDLKEFYPNNTKYEDCLTLLEYLYKAYSWNKEESKGQRPMVKSYDNLKYLAALMSNWMNSTPLNLVIKNMIAHHNIEGKIWLSKSRQFETFDAEDREHINEVINNLIYDIDNFLRFRIKNYLSNYELLVSNIKGDIIAPWSSYIEYGTTKSEIIALQDVGISRHLALYLTENHIEHFDIRDGEITFIDLDAILKSINNNEFKDEKKELEELFLG